MSYLKVSKAWTACALSLISDLPKLCLSIVLTRNTYFSEF